MDYLVLDFPLIFYLNMTTFLGLKYTDKGYDSEFFTYFYKM